MTAPRFEFTSQRPGVSRLPTEPPGRPALHSRNQYWCSYSPRVLQGIPLWYKKTKKSLVEVQHQKKSLETKDMAYQLNNKNAVQDGCHRGNDKTATLRNTLYLEHDDSLNNLRPHNSHSFISLCSGTSPEHERRQDNGYNGYIMSGNPGENVYLSASDISGHRLALFPLLKDLGTR